MTLVRLGLPPASAPWRIVLVIAAILTGLVFMHQLGGPPAHAQPTPRAAAAADRRSGPGSPSG